MGYLNNPLSIIVSLNIHKLAQADIAIKLHDLFLTANVKGEADQHLAAEELQLLGRDLNDSNHPNFLERRA